jgi:3-oxoacyl-[acyl-carrier protein] reductase
MVLKDQVALVTGGGQGIGAETARLFAENGAAVFIADWDDAAARKTADAIVKSGGKADVMKVDVSKQAEAEAAVAAAVKAFGRLDILINNAGITRDTSALKMEPHQWDQVIAVNLSGVFYCARAAAAQMKEQQYGRIATASSISAFGNFGQANYSATKAGVVGLTRTLALEWARYGITVNAIMPGFIETAMTDAMPEEAKNATKARIPVGRIGQPIDIARTYLFLCSPASSFITGRVFVIDGGMSLGGG